MRSLRTFSTLGSIGARPPARARSTPTIRFRAGPPARSPQVEPGAKIEIEIRAPPLAPVHFFRTIDHRHFFFGRHGCAGGCVARSRAVTQVWRHDRFAPTPGRHDPCEASRRFARGNRARRRAGASDRQRTNSISNRQRDRSAVATATRLKGKPNVRDRDWSQPGGAGFVRL